jgi:hypothetical protein
MLSVIARYEKPWDKNEKYTCVLMFCSVIKTGHGGNIDVY